MIFQFIIFFMIGLSIFLLAGNLFRFQAGLIKKDILDASSTLSTRQISSLAINSIDSCKSCDNVTINYDQKPVVGHSPIYQLSNGVILKIDPESKILQSSMHNIYYSITYDSSDVSSAKTIALTYDKIKNKLVMQ